METLVVVPQHRNHGYSRNRNHRPVHFGSFGSPNNSMGFRGMNCRSFESRPGLLPTPMKPCITPVAKPSFAVSSPKAPAINCRSEGPKGSKRFSRSSAVSIPIRFKPESVDFDKPRSLNEKFNYSESWAGPTYSSSPPPSSLPIPKFSLRTKRTNSLELPCSVSDIDLHPIAKSAPASPSRGKSPPFRPDVFDDGNVSATKNLRRILNLDPTDE